MMRYLITIFALLLVPFSVFAITLTSDVTYDYLEIGTGATLDTDGFDVTVGGGTGATIIYGFLDATHLNGNSTLFTQKANGFITLGTGDVKFTQTGTLLLTSSGTDVTNPNTLTVSGSLMDLTIDNGLVGYWRLDDGIGSTVARDSSRYGNHGTLTAMDPSSDWVANPAHSMGSFFNPYALDFDGTDDYVISTSNISGMTSDFTSTISVWVKFNDLNTGFKAVADFSNAGPATTEGFALFQGTDGAGSLSAGFYSGRRCSISAAVSTGQWYHIVITKTSGSISTSSTKLYLNGTLQSLTCNSSATPSFDGGKVYIGSDSASEVSNSILADDVRIYSRALSSNEVERLSEGDPSTGSGV